MIALRVVAWTVLYAVALRALGSAVGVWAAGTLTAAASLLLGIVAPLWLFLLFPSWVAFRVAVPLRLRALARAGCWLSPLVRARELAGVRLFVDAAMGRALAVAPGAIVDAWTALAIAVDADRRREAARADRIADALTHLPAGSRFSWLARVHGVEALLASALARGDWGAVRRYVPLGRGRLVAFWNMLADAQAGARIPRARRWGRWLLAPRRSANLRFLRAFAVAARGSLAGTTSAPRASAAPPPAGDVAGGGGEDVRLQHLRLLATAARQDTVSTGEVLALAAGWQAQLDDAALARVRARALELGARDGLGGALGIRDGVLGELVELAAIAEGPPLAPPAGAFGGELGRRLRARLFERVEEAIAGLGGGRGASTSGPPSGPLDAWERWLVLRTAIDELELREGIGALSALWYGGLRDAVWGVSYAMFNAERTRSAWVAHMMFNWIADRSERLGDFPSTLLNRENARSALAAST